MSCGWLDLGAFKARLGVTSTTADVAMTGVLAGVQSSIQGIIGSPVAQVTRSYRVAGHGTQQCVLEERPICVSAAAVADLHVYVVADDATTETAGDELTYLTDFYFEGNADPQAGRDYRMSGIMVRANWCLWPLTNVRWPNRLAPSLIPQRRVIVITGIKVGWLLNDIPPAILEAGYLEAATLWGMRKGNAGPYTSESLNGYSYSLGSSIPGIDKYGAPRLVNQGATILLAPFAGSGVSRVR